MAFIRSTTLLAASVLALGLLTTGALAHTAEQQQMCSGDAMRLCGEFIPDVDRITACMIQKYSQLSDGCKSVFHGPAPTARTPAQPVNYTPATTTRPSKPLTITPNLKRG
jgi:hypothetical protein